MVYHRASSSGPSRRQVSSPRGGSGSGRRVTPASSLSSRFQQVQESRRTVSAPPASAGGRLTPGRASRSSLPVSPVGRGGNRGPKGRQGGSRGGVGRTPTGSGPAPTRRAFRTASHMMDVDSGHNPGRRGGSPSRGAGRGRGRGRTGGRGSGARSGRPASGGGRREPPNKDRLDMDLDNYMIGDSKTGRSVLDQDLDSYMMSNPSASI